MKIVENDLGTIWYDIKSIDRMRTSFRIIEPIAENNSTLVDEERVNNVDIVLSILFMDS